MEKITWDILLCTSLPNFQQINDKWQKKLLLHMWGSCYLQTLLDLPVCQWDQLGRKHQEHLEHQERQQDQCHHDHPAATVSHVRKGTCYTVVWWLFNIYSAVYMKESILK